MALLMVSWCAGKEIRTCQHKATVLTEVKIPRPKVTIRSCNDKPSTAGTSLFLEAKLLGKNPNLPLDKTTNAGVNAALERQN